MAGEFQDYAFKYFKTGTVFSKEAFICRLRSAHLMLRIDSGSLKRRQAVKLVCTDNCAVT